MSRTPHTELATALAAIDAFDGLGEDFELVISDSLMDPVGYYMAIIVDRILGKGWEPHDFEEYPGYRVYRYKPME